LGGALSNPKGLLFFTAVLPQFIDPSQSQAEQYAILAMIAAILDTFVMSCYAIGGAQAAKYLSVSSMRLLNRTCAAAMISLAGFLALYRRADA
jgi:homoserine/homoserine lactone efflux protein